LKDQSSDVARPAPFNRENSDWANDLRDADERARKTLESLKTLQVTYAATEETVQTLRT
jgi:hypothetical protein